MLYLGTERKKYAHDSWCVIPEKKKSLNYVPRSKSISEIPTTTTTTAGITNDLFRYFYTYTADLSEKDTTSMLVRTYKSP